MRHATPLTRRSAFLVPEGVLVQDLDDEIVLLDLESERYFSLDPIGSDIWRRLAAGASLGEVLDDLQREYRTDLALIERDVERLVLELLSSGLVHGRAP